ncbi:MAG TPA: V-type ATP synthase subunit A [Anaerolineales bacterium]|nr:V-type ATP synthase subunit A [Anaerolineales bacterium]
MDYLEQSCGKITRIAGPVVGASGLENARLHDVVHVGQVGLVGEIIQMASNQTTIQVYEDTSGIRIGEPIKNTGTPLQARLGPGLLGQVYDGLQRPLQVLAENTGDFIQRGLAASPLNENTLWEFQPRVSTGQFVSSGSVLGIVPESQTIDHVIMVPPGKGGRLVDIRAGQCRLNDVVAVIELQDNHQAEYFELTLCQTWPVRTPRPVYTRLSPREPLVTGTRIIDTLFPIARGGSAIIPGGFGTGKTVVEHTLARWADADVVVYIGCGERGNEMTEVLEEFPTLEDPRTGKPLMERTVLIANTSNMPVAAREASVYTGITIAEYYRDMGYQVLVLADSTSRWGEALREISGRLEEMPGEEGYPAYLAARLAEFYERSGRVVCLGSPQQENDLGADSVTRTGSVTLVGAVSPPGGDFSEPMTQNSMRVVGTFWALDYDLSRRRHFPAINWTRSYSLYETGDWYARNVAQDWNERIRATRGLLQREVELLEIVQLVGPDALAENERAVLAVARMLREDFLQQSAYHEVDRYCPIEKAYWMMVIILDFYQSLQSALGLGIALENIINMPEVGEIARLKELPAGQAVQTIQELSKRVQHRFAELGVQE